MRPREATADSDTPGDDAPSGARMHGPQAPSGMRPSRLSSLLAPDGSTAPGSRRGARAHAPVEPGYGRPHAVSHPAGSTTRQGARSEEHTSELQSPYDLV